jgi:hypothetical protein
MMMLTIISPFGQLGLWALFLVRGAMRCIYINHVCFHITPLSLRSLCMTCAYDDDDDDDDAAEDDDDDDDDNNKPDWPTWAVGALI